MTVPAAAPTIHLHERSGVRPAERARPALHSGVYPWRIRTGLLILTAAGLRLAYLASDHALDLAPDEAHYWDWSRHLDWSYYSKGPLVAYLIRASCALVGGWSQALVGSEMLAVRLPAVVCGSLLLVSLYVLTVQTTGREHLAAAVVACGLTLPLVTAGSTLMTIDAPYSCCWGWALVFGHRAIFGRSRWAWLAAGLAVGLGILAKYTMVLWLPSLALFLLATPALRPLLRSRGFWGMTLVAGLCCIPILWWNVQHDWVTVRHVGGQAGLSPTAGFRPTGPLLYLATQFVLLLGFWFVPWCAGLIVHRPWVEAEPRLCYLWWMAVPMFIFFGLFSLRTNIEANWPVTAYLSGGVVAAVWLERQLRSPHGSYRRWTHVCLGTALGLGLILNVFLYFSPLAHPILARLAGPPTPERPFPLRQFDPSCRLRGWRDLAKEIDRLRAFLQEQGTDPVLAGTGWTLPGELSFYCTAHPQVFSLGLALGDRHSQYDGWRPNPLADPSEFQGRTFLCVGEVTPLLRQAFDHVEEPRRFVHHAGDQALAGWTITICRGYRGFGPVLRQQESGRY